MGSFCFVLQSWETGPHSTPAFLFLAQFSAQGRLGAQEYEKHSLSPSLCVSHLEKLLRLCSASPEQGVPRALHPNGGEDGA